MMVGRSGRCRSAFSPTDFSRQGAKLAKEDKGEKCRLQNIRPVTVQR